MPDQPARPAMTMSEIRTALGYTEPPVLVEVTRYEVSVLPRDDINRKYFTLFVDNRGDGRWSVNDGHGCYAADGTWAAGMKPFHLDGWENSHRFSLDEALTLAKRLAPSVSVNGHTAAEAYRRTHPDA
ncbi:hypothetical protein ACFVZH_02525 [Streptomyces sp. NPDC059534]|uniref:hypothetical protein n=1 Tax=Streptomyces sp. NPDC059534 TaxID=3346859 RepID=UPI0036934AE0